ncbi:DUF5115 domain-containing protein [Bacteroides helcogenes]|uniref:Uncharacterized protein n=1 Tax=Bacteroides helcogenes (strain ATCC 35417 / DSM 20613 / JCM 6297 / CCUG 15421 / P 36-108) TaxID=693979 RepID=E6SQE9_BACT6|nr:DUF5115 domain-containing protein [Bacteroides helcogenes]ADV44996.1 hypothetical protein Bache_3068 [Bacteroides helcogenes P 36-108]MDY5239855.1 DUF5115 domain-containing protein [Bacteroides helcogenes]
MKKILFYTLFAAVALTTVSCDEDFNKDVAAPQGWPQEEAVTLPGFNASAASAVDLATADSVVVFTYTTPANMPEGTSIANFRLEITPDAIDGASAVIVNTASNGKVASADLQKIIEDSYGKRPIERTLNTRIYANLMKDGQASLLTCDPIIIKATPKAPVISNAYYLIGVAGWEAKDIIKFNHSGKDVYEDPVFALMITTTKPDTYWKIIPQGNVDADAAGVENGLWQAGVVGVTVDGDDSMNGTLINTGDVKAAKIAKAGMYSITLNMMDYTYTVKEIVPEYYIVGAMQGWNADATKGKTCMLYPQSAMIHSYTTQFKDDANLKLWLGSDFGSWNACFGATVDGDNSTSGSLTGTGAGAIVCPEKGAYYTFKVDFSTMTYAWTKLENQSPVSYKTVGLIGDFNGWGGDFAMTEVTPHNWHGAGLAVSADGGIKFRANAVWDVNWGVGKDLSHDLSVDNYGVGVKNSGNLKIAAGTYNVFFNDITGEFVFKVVG